MRVAAGVRLDVFGREIAAVRTADGWTTYLVGADGKRRRAPELLVPPNIGEDELSSYLADLCHEWASQEHPDVRRID